MKTEIMQTMNTMYQEEGNESFRSREIAWRMTIDNI